MADPSMIAALGHPLAVPTSLLAYYCGDGRPMWRGAGGGTRAILRLLLRGSFQAHSTTISSATTAVIKRPFLFIAWLVTTD